MNTNLYLFLENLIFLIVVTSFLAIVSWAWKDLKPFSLPEPLPGWFKIWFGTVQVLGGLLPLAVILLWGVLWGDQRVLTVLIPYFVMLAFQIISEILTLRRFHSVVWVMVPYLYLPYRIWQLYEGWIFINPQINLNWLGNLLILEIIVWTVNYALDLAQLPRLLRWQIQENNQIENSELSV
ncbi:MAG: hypothetical protein PUP93_19590 [Rhizonema sp. NSF051]|nr:hypothetical protein [Rhizonema sp. NSF051]